MFCFDIETRNFFIFVYQDCYCYRIWLVMMRMTDVKKQTIIMMIRMIKWSRFIWLMFSFLHNVVVVVRFGFKWIWFNKKKNFIRVFHSFNSGIAAILFFFFLFLFWHSAHTHTHSLYMLPDDFQVSGFHLWFEQIFFSFFEKKLIKRVGWLVQEFIYLILMMIWRWIRG